MSDDPTQPFGGNPSYQPRDNTFRHDYKENDEPARLVMKLVKDNASMLLEAIQDYMPDSREKSIAIRKLEEAVMWAVKGITK